MKCWRSPKDQVGGSENLHTRDLSPCLSTPELGVTVHPRKCHGHDLGERDRGAEHEQRRPTHALRVGLSPRTRPTPPHTPRGGISASEHNLFTKQNDTAAEEKLSIQNETKARGDQKNIAMRQEYSNSYQNSSQASPCKVTYRVNAGQKGWRQDKPVKHCSRSRSQVVEVPSHSNVDSEALLRQVRDVHHDVRNSSRIIRDSRARLLEMQKKSNLTEADAKELGDRHELLLREMERFDRLTRTVQRLVDNETGTLHKRSTPNSLSPTRHGNPGYEPVMCQEMKMAHPTVLLGRAHLPAHAHLAHPHSYADAIGTDVTRSKSEIDLTRKLSESYDMQEKLVADNADLEVKRYILYKELMTKDQNLETCRAQVKRLQGELKLMSKENAQLHERLSRNCPEGDAGSINHDPSSHQKNIEEIQLQSLEIEVRTVHEEMQNIPEIKKAAQATSLAGAGKPACHKGKGTCYPAEEKKQPPKEGKACGVCPPCPAPCNPKEPPTPLERECAKLTNKVKTLDEALKQKVTECAMLRSEVTKRRDDAEKDKQNAKEMAAKLRDAEERIEAMLKHNSMMQGTKNQVEMVETNVRALKQCYREAREEVDELRMLLKDQNEQLQDYRNKYLQALQTVEEQKRQLDVMDMDNSRISEQINLEIYKIRNNFQEKMREFEPLPKLLKETEAKLNATRQAQAMAEHQNERLGQELNTARERIHVLLHNLVKPPEVDRPQGEDRQVTLLHERIKQMHSSNQSLKREIERLKAKVIRMEESVQANEKRLYEKMEECTKLGGELDRMQDDAALAVARANERVETLRETMKITRDDLERQLASTRAQLRIVEKDREEIQCRMTCQIKKLKDNYEKSQLRIMALGTKIAHLRHAAGSDNGDGDSVDECQCSFAK